MKAPFEWDHYSDQPYQIKERAFKKAMRKRNWFSLLKTVLTALIVLPLSILFLPFGRRNKITSADFFGMSINLDKEPDLTPELVEELGVTSLLIRFPLWEVDNIHQYHDFVTRFRDKKILLNIMQDREHIEDLDLLKENLSQVFKTFSPYVELFQIGTTINRAKWGFFSVDEYLRFYQVAYRLKKEQFPDIRLIGSGVIDFEYHFTAHTLFNFFRLRYDGIAALLYVDRRGAPENTQIGFSLTEKIALLKSMMTLSLKTTNQLYITETNWPITGTAPYAPTSEYECVDEESYADFMVRYYLLAWATQKVDAVYWHQLIAPGYGLVDNLGETPFKRNAFYAFKTMVSLMHNATFTALKIENTLYTLQCHTAAGTLHILWSLGEDTVTFDHKVHTINRDGRVTYQDALKIGSSPVYIYPKSTQS